MTHCTHSACYSKYPLQLSEHLHSCKGCVNYEKTDLPINQIKNSELYSYTTEANKSKYSSAARLLIGKNDNCWVHTLHVLALNISYVFCEEFVYSVRSSGVLCEVVRLYQVTAKIGAMEAWTTSSPLKIQWLFSSLPCLRGIHSWSGGRRPWDVSSDPLLVSDVDTPSRSSYTSWCVCQDRHIVSTASFGCDSNSRHIADTEYVSCCGACQSLMYP